MRRRNFRIVHVPHSQVPRTDEFLHITGSCGVRCAVCGVRCAVLTNSTPITSSNQVTLIGSFLIKSLKVKTCVGRAILKRHIIARCTLLGPEFEFSNCSVLRFSRYTDGRYLRDRQGNLDNLPIGAESQYPCNFITLSHLL